ncbi:hypothetical protein QU487_07810 [Crenobacter sp. SG2305]|uniref:hypothetical protein n=1 Tax=Crenobacter oryzisoli TaxID=3056844 RepID=UPI0025AA505E|nr:hypothetical protein [Crenobacter sp. SG2305]MDN0082653.1 hypothetical protein [Crenobacter sp. SG2305]
MQWQKLGIIHAPDGRHPQAVSHAMIPTPLLMDDGRLRVYYSSCDAQGRGRPFYVDLSADDPRQVLDDPVGPLLDLGQPGAFDDNGAVCCSMVRAPDGRYFMYYVGFELHQTVRYKLFTGLAISEDGQHFTRHSTVPILDRSPHELCFRCGPCVRYEDGRFRMWYIAGSDWEDIDGKAMPVYQLHYLESPDGIHWPARGELIMAIENADEHGFGRPWVLPSDGGYELHYSIRRRSLRAYRLGWASSTDGRCWLRCDAELGLDAGPGSEDDEAIMYAAPVRIGERTYCFYNGNGFGRDGIALAIAHSR